MLFCLLSDSPTSRHPRCYLDKVHNFLSFHLIPAVSKSLAEKENELYCTKLLLRRSCSALFFFATHVDRQGNFLRHAPLTLTGNWIAVARASAICISPAARGEEEREVASVCRAAYIWASRCYSALAVRQCRTERKKD